MNKLFRLYILLVFFPAVGVFAFADGPSSALNDKPSVDTAAVSKEQAILERNQGLDKKVREYYEKGVELTNAGKLDEARDYFEKATRIIEPPGMAGYINESQRQPKEQETSKEDVEAAYKEAIDLYEQKKYHPAKDAFEHVDEMAPDYRATSSYLKIIDQDIIMANALAPQQQAIEIEHQQKEAEAARAKEKAMGLAQIEEKEKERKESINKQAEEVYTQAVELYKNKRFAEAKRKFEEVNIPGYKATMEYLGSIERDAQEEQERAARQQQKALQEQRWEEEVERKKQEALRQHELEVEEVERKKQEALRQHELEVKALQHKKDIEEQAQFLYTAAVNLFNNKAMDEALEEFNDIENTCPDFKSTRVYMARIKQWQFDQQQRQVKEQKRQQQEALEQKKRQEEQERAARQQQKALQEQRWEEEGERKKQEAALQHKKDLEEQTQFLYTAAVNLFNNKAMDEALEKFNGVENTCPDFKSTRVYMARIKQWQFDQKQRQMEEQKRQQQEALEQKKRQFELEVNGIYLSAMDRYRVGDFEGSKEEFLKVNERIPDYKSTGRYLSKIEKIENKIMQDQADRLRQLQRQEEEQKRQQQEAQIRQRHQFELEVNEMYISALKLYRAHDFEGSKAEFLKVNEKIPGYEFTQRYLSKIDNEIKQIQSDRLLGQLQRQKEEQKRQQQEAGLRQRRQLELEVNRMYIAALKLYRASDFEGSKAEFLKVNEKIPGYESTQRYLSKIDSAMASEAKPPKHPVLITSTPSVEEVKKAQVDQMRQKELAYERQQAQKLKDQTDQAQKIYTLALRSYRDHHWEESRAQFESVEKMVPDFKHTRWYLQNVEIIIAMNAKVRPAVVVPTPKAPPVAVVPKAAISPVPSPAAAPPAPVAPPGVKRPNGGDIASLDVISALAEKSARLYRQIADIADDRTTLPMKRKMAEVDEVLNNLKEEKERLLRQMREEQWRRQQEESKAKQEERRAENEKIYQEGVEYLRSHEYAKAKVKFLELENIIPDYKATRRYLSRIEKYQKQASVEALTAHEQKEAERLKQLYDKEAARFKQLQDKENANQLRRAQREQEEQHHIELQQQASLKELAQKASGINDDIIRLSRQQDYEAMKVKFTELENTVIAVKTLKDEMAKQKDRQERERQRQKKLTEELERQKRLYEEDRLLGLRKEETMNAQEREKANPPSRLIVSAPGAPGERQRLAQLEARREAIRKQLEDGLEAMYQEALSLYKRGDYTAAADKFKDVQDIVPGYKRSEQYMDEARRKSLTVNPQAVNAPPEASAVPSSPLMSYQDHISRALDLFDSDAKRF